MKLLVQTIASETLELKGSRIFRRQQGRERRGRHDDQPDQHGHGRHDHQHEHQHENQRPDDVPGLDVEIIHDSGALVVGM